MSPLLKNNRFLIFSITGYYSGNYFFKDPDTKKLLVKIFSITLLKTFLKATIRKLQSQIKDKKNASEIIDI